MSMDIKLIKAQLSIFIHCRVQSSWCFAGPLMKVAVYLAKNVLAPFATAASASAVGIAT